MKKTHGLLALALALCLLLCACAGAAPSSSTAPSGSASAPAAGVPAQEAAALRLEDDYYDTINAVWMAETPIPGDSPNVSAFSQVQDEIDKTLRADLDAMLASDEPQDGKMQMVTDFYRLTADYDTRNQLGMEPLLPILERIEGYESLAQLSGDAADLMLEGYPLPFSLFVAADPADSTVYALNASEASLLLGSRSYYEEAKQLGDQITPLVEAFMLTMFDLAGYSEEEAAQHWQAAQAFDAALVPLVLTDVVAYDSAATYNPTDFAEFAAASQSFDMTAIVTALCGQAPQQVILDNPDFYTALDSVVNEDTFEQLKSWILVNTMAGYASYLNEDARQAAETMRMAMVGQAEMTAPDKAAYDLATGTFAEIVGQYYGQTYFGQQGRDDVTGMVEDIIAVYRQRLQDNDWLSPDTVEQAITKLDAMTINVGWPDKLSPVYDQFTVTTAEEGGTLLGNVADLTSTSKAYNYSLLGTPVEKGLWGMGAHVVNAFYDPTTNGIFMPAAILNAPFYSTQQADSQNYGGIGVVIGHEITHAFDANGSLYDENGSMRDWWTAEDRAEFEARTEAMVALFDGRPIADIEVNGALTKTENVADAGGMSCALQITRALPDADLEEFFESYAAIWRSNDPNEYINMVYLTDVHSPGKLRVNVQLGNCDTFYEVYGVQEGDGMYIAPEQRVSIW